MCGISGIVSFGLSPERMLSAVRLMGRYLNHRGPDAWGEWTGAGVVLGHNRLAILDLHGGVQPMATAAGEHVIVFNGEIYNFRELREEIKANNGCLRTDHSDTEAIVEGYRLWGEDVFLRLEGMFACAIWTPANRRLVLARDRLGIKPLYYCSIGGGGLAFASEPKALVGSAIIESRFDDAGLAEYFLFRAPLHPRTLFAGVNKLAPATVLRHDATEGHTIEYRFWEPSSSSYSLGAKAREESLSEVADRAVRSHLVADVEVGVFLSGGVDSSLVAALAARSQRIRAFTVSSPGPLDELGFATQVAGRVGAQLNSRVVLPEDMLGCLEEWAYFNDDPVADPSALALMLLSKDVKANGLKVMLSGEGGDEMFGGYPAYSRFLAARAVTGVIGDLPTWLNRSGDFRVRDYLADSDSPYWGTAHITSVAMRRELLGRESDNLAMRLVGEASAPTPLRHAMLVDQRFRLSSDILMRTDRATMASSVEARVPLLSNEILMASSVLGQNELCRLLPPQNKPLLKRITARLVGRDVVYRRKIGFDLPIAQWLGREFGSRVAGMIKERLIPGVSYATITRWYESLRRGSLRVAAVLWAWFVLELWYRLWITRPAEPRVASASG